MLMTVGLLDKMQSGGLKPAGGAEEAENLARCCC